MKFIKQQVSKVIQEPGIIGMLKQCELVGRVCYHSEHNITNHSYEKFIKHQILQNHMSPLEAGTVYLAIPTEEHSDLVEFFKDNHYSFAVVQSDLTYVTTNYRVIVENELDGQMQQFWVEPTEYHMPRLCFRLETCIEVYKDFTRHRSHSPMIESTRFCNYILEKFSRCVAFTLPNWLGYKSGKSAAERKWLEEKLNMIEEAYFEAQELWGWDAQRASYLLPQGTKATAFFTAFLPDWEWFLKLRYEQITGPVRPDVLEIATYINDIINGEH